MKRIALILGMIIILSTLIIGAIPVYANYNDTIQNGISTNSWGGVAVTKNVTVSNSWVASNTCTLSSIQLHLYMNTLHFGFYTLELAVFSGSTPTGNPIGYGYLNTYNVGWGSGSAAWHNITIVTEPYLTSGQTYCWELFIPSTPDSQMSIQVIGTNDTDAHISYPTWGLPNPVTMGNGYWKDLSQNGWTTGGYDLQFLIMGNEENSTVQTYDVVTSSIPGNLTLQGEVIKKGIESSLICGFQWGATSAYEQGETETTTINDYGTAGKYSIDISNLPISGTINFRAFAYCPIQDITIYGANMPYSWSGLNGAIGSNETLIITTGNVSKISYNSVNISCSLDNLGIETSVAVNILISKTATGLDDTFSGTSISIASGVTGHANWNSTITNLDSNTKYFYIAQAEGTTVNYYGDIKSFTTHDESKSYIVNVINDLFNKLGLSSSIWWLIIFILIASVWLIRQVRERPIIGLIMDLLILGAGITMVLSIWVTALLALGAGVTIYGFLFARGSS